MRGSPLLSRLENGDEQMERRKIKDDIKRSFITYTTIIIIAILTVYLLSLLMTFYVSIVEPGTETNEQIAEQIETGFDRYRAGMKELAKEESIIDFLNGKGESSIVNQLLYDFRNGSSLHSHFALLQSTGEVLASSYYTEQKEELEQSVVLNSIIGKTEENGFNEEYVNKRLINGDSGGVYVFAAAVQISSTTNGYLLFILDHPLYPPSSQKVVVADRFNNAIFYSHSFGIDRLGKLAEPIEGKFIQYEGSPYYVTATIVEEQRIQVFTLTAIHTYKLLLLYGIMAMVVSSFVILVVVWLVTPKILKKSLEPFDALVAIVASKNNNEHFQQNGRMSVEVQTIYEEYTNKVNEIEALVNKNQEIMETKRLSEIKHLEAKFNPHFLYNVLEMIKYETLANPESASEMIVKTAKLMRYNANFGDTTVLLKEDLAYLHDYFALQKMRYGKRLHYSIQIAESLEQTRVPKLLLQPLVENAIKHSIDETNELMVNLTAKIAEGDLLFHVIDNGSGMSKQRLEEVKAVIVEETVETEHTGLKNTHQMIQLLYGNKYGLTIEATPSVGTIVQVKIPYKG